MKLPIRSSISSLRSYATPSFAPGASASSPASPFIVFDRQAKLAQRDRAALDKERSRLTDYVKDEVAANMVDRLLVSSLSLLRLALELFAGHRGVLKSWEDVGRLLRAYSSC